MGKWARARYTPINAHTHTRTHLVLALLAEGLVLRDHGLEVFDEDFEAVVWRGVEWWWNKRAYGGGAKTSRKRRVFCFFPA